jgi:zinc/manganese transport system ATP-binding protein
MAAQIKFRDVTLGYDRHPAVHHLNGEVAQARCWRWSGRTAPASRRCFAGSPAF